MIKLEFEGTDGAGKTTGLKYFIEQARAKGLTVVETREVGNPNIPACIKLREFVLDPNSNLSGEAMEFIFSAMRYENDRWFRELARGPNPPDLVISDRGWLSHLSYTDHNVSERFTKLLYGEVLSNTTILPDAVIYFSVNTETALKRRIKRGEGMDVIEMKGVEFQNKVRDSFDKYIDELDEFGDVSIFRVDANESIEGVRRQLDDLLSNISWATKAF